MYMTYCIGLVICRDVNFILVVNATVVDVSLIAFLCLAYAFRPLNKTA